MASASATALVGSASPATFSSYFERPTPPQAGDGLNVRIWFVFKRSVEFVSYLVSMPGPLASGIRHLGDQIVPCIEHFAGCPGRFSAILVPMRGLVVFSDLNEPTNDLNWFINGCFATAMKKCHYFAVVAHGFLVPTNISGLILFARDIHLGNFAFLGEWAAKIGSLPYCGMVANFSLLPACFATLTLAYAFFALDVTQKWMRNSRKLAALEANPADLSLPNGIKAKMCREKNEKVAASHFKSAADKQNSIQHKRDTITNAKWDLFLCSSKIGIYTVLMGRILGWSCLSAVGAGPFALGMAGLGLCAMYGVGRSIYMSKHYLKPQIEYLHT